MIWFGTFIVVIRNNSDHNVTKVALDLLFLITIIHAIRMITVAIMLPSAPKSPPDMKLFPCEVIEIIVLLSVPETANPKIFP